MPNTKDCCYHLPQASRGTALAERWAGAPSQFFKGTWHRRRSMKSNHMRDAEKEHVTVQWGQGRALYLFFSHFPGS
jgi:hypothetical protein